VEAYAATHGEEALRLQLGYVWNVINLPILECKNLCIPYYISKKTNLKCKITFWIKLFRKLKRCMK